MSDRVRSSPPALTDFTYVESIGGGGFADVFLYRQHRPSRNVAIKVLRAEHLSPSAIEQFDHEANVMAEVSTHPYIVTVYSSGVAPDGRPFIVMEHYPQPHFAVRARGGTMSAAEVLRTGVQIASAVHHAHGSGIIHRDIKPANILTSEFGKPGLTDFGISGVVSEGTASSSAGLTIEFAPPEAIRDPETPTGIQGDVYSLAATIYALLAGRPPFWVVGGHNSDQDLIGRTVSQKAPPTGRSDIGPLEHLLAGALSQNIGDRPASALAFARSLQDVEQQLHLPTSTIEARGEHKPQAPVDRGGDDSTRMPLQVVHPDGPGASTRSSTPPASSPPPSPIARSPRPESVAPAPVRLPAERSGADPPTDHGMEARTVVRSGDRGADLGSLVQPTAEPSTTSPEVTRSRPSTPLLIGAGALALAVIGFILISLSGGSEATQEEGERASPTTTRPPLHSGSWVRLPTDVEVSWDAGGSRYEVRWTEIDVPEGSAVTYRVQPVDPSTGDLTDDPDLMERFGAGWSVTGDSLAIQRLQLGGAPPPCIRIMTIADNLVTSDLSQPVCP